MKSIIDNPVIMEDMMFIYEHVPSNKVDNSSILVTGASGMIASYFVSFLIYLVEERHYKIRIDLGVRNIKKAKELFGANGTYINYVEYDANKNNSFCREYDYILHAASLASPQYYGLKPVETMLPNLLGLNELLIKSKNDGARLLFLSTGSVYGNVDEVNVITEDMYGMLDYLSPGNVYGESKRCGEALCMSYNREYNIPVVVARIHHSYGPTMDYKNDCRVFSEFVKNVINNENIELKSDGLSKRPFCYMSDLIIQLFTILVSGDSGGVYNVGNPYEVVTIRELAECIGNLAEPKLDIIIRERNDESYCPEKIIHDTQFSIEKVEKLCNYKPTISIESGFKRTIKAIQLSD